MSVRFHAGILVAGGVLLSACTASLAGTASTGGAAPTSSPSPSAPTFASTYEQVSSGVARVVAVGCTGTGTGSGLRVGPDLVATAAHVVDGAETVSVRGPGGVTKAQIIGIDADNDLALLQTKDPLQGFTFAWKVVQPAVSMEAAAIGYPYGLPLSISRGTVAGTDRRVTVAGRTLTGLIQVDVPINPGNSGGPLIDIEGNVLGLAEAGDDGAQSIAYVTPWSVAAPILKSWADSGTQQPLAHCPLVDGVIAVSSKHADAGAVRQSLENLIAAVADDDDDEAKSYLSGDALRDGAFLDDLTGAGAVTGMLTKLVLIDVDSDDLEMTLVTGPAIGAPSSQCISHKLRMVMRLDSGRWTIDQVEQDVTTRVTCRR